jgi:plasmid stabilization system protein ParE
MKRVYIRPSADADLNEIFAWIAADDSVAAARLVERIVGVARKTVTVYIFT